MDLNGKNEGIEKDINYQLEDTKQEIDREIQESEKNINKKNSIISNIVTIICIIISIGLVYICATSIFSFFSLEENQQSTISNYSSDFNGDYIEKNNYSIKLVDEEIYYLNDQIPIIVTEWDITNNGEIKGYPAAYLIATQFKGEEEVELQDAETLLIKYDADSNYWSEKFNTRFSNIEPGETNKIYTAFILYNENEEVYTEWTDLSGT